MKSAFSVKTDLKVVLPRYETLTVYLVRDKKNREIVYSGTQAEAEAEERRLNKEHYANRGCVKCPPGVSMLNFLAALVEKNNR